MHQPYGTYLHRCRRRDARQPGSLARAATQFYGASVAAHSRTHHQAQRQPLSHTGVELAQGLASPVASCVLRVIR